MDPSVYEKRRKALRDISASSHLDAVLLTSLENIRYLSGFTGSDGALVLTPKESFFLTDSRYWTQAEEEVSASRIVHYRNKIDGIVSLFLDVGLKAVGFESLSLSFSSYRSLTEKSGGEIRMIPLENEIKRLRVVKDHQELALMLGAIDISSKAFEHVLGRIKEETTEKEIAFEMEFFMKNHGAEAVAFDIVVASGKRSALPHGRASTKRIERGDFVIIDYGCRFQGYSSDETCTLVYGDASAKQREIYQIVKDAHDKAVEAVRVGIALQEVDRAARDHIRQCGYDEYFGHGTGHGIGLGVHEEPGVNRENKDLVVEGMVFTIEPGIYLPDWGGVRIEDMVLVTSQGAKTLTYQPKGLTVL